MLCFLSVMLRFLTRFLARFLGKLPNFLVYFWRNIDNCVNFLYQWSLSMYLVTCFLDLQRVFQDLLTHFLDPLTRFLDLLTRFLVILGQYNSISFDGNSDDLALLVVHYLKRFITRKHDRRSRKRVRGPGNVSGGPVGLSGGPENT